MQKISFFQRLTLHIQSILESYHHTDHTTFDHAHPKNFQSPFNLREFVKACKKSINSICSFWRYSKFQSPETRSSAPIFDHAQPKNFQSLFNFCKFV